MSDRELTGAECTAIQAKATAFAAEWAAHGKALASAAEVRFNRFLVLMVDEGYNAASGCSIDTSVRFVKQLESAYGIDFFDRMLVAYRTDNGNISTTSMHKLKDLLAEGQINEYTAVFNNLVRNKSELDTAWEVPLKDSVYARLI